MIRNRYIEGIDLSWCDYCGEFVREVYCAICGDDECSHCNDAGCVTSADPYFCEILEIEVVYLDWVQTSFAR